MEDIIFGCSVTDKVVNGNFNYYLYSRIDGYAIILKEKTDQTDWKFRVIRQNEDVDTVWADAVNKTDYARPDKFSSSDKRYIGNSTLMYKSANATNLKDW